MASDKELELKLKATGGAAAAAEVQKVEEAVEAVAEASEKAAVEMTPAWEAVTDAATKTGTEAAIAGEAMDDIVDPSTLESLDAAEEWLKRLGDSTDDAGESAARYAGELEMLLRSIGKLPGPVGAAAGKLAGFVGAASRFGPHVAVAAAAAAAGAGSMKLLLDHLDRVEAAANRGLPDLAQTSQRAAVEMSDLEIQTRAAADAARAADKGYADFAKRLRRVADEQAAITDAELGEELAAIDLDELNGHFTEAEAAEARYNARREAEARKAAAEIQAIEQELNNRRQQNELDRQEWLASQDPANAANAALTLAQRQGARGVSGLEAEQEAVRKAMADLSASETIDPEERAALEAAVTAAQEALAAAFEEMIADLIAEREAAVAVVIEKRKKLQAGQSDQAALERELENQTTGSGAQVRGAREREAALRFEADKRRREIEEEKRVADENQKAAAVAARLAADEEARRLAAEAARMSGNASASGQVDASVIGALDNAAARLGDGTDQAELTRVLDRLTSTMEGIPEAQRSALTPLIRRLETLEAQFKNRPDA